MFAFEFTAQDSFTLTLNILGIFREAVMGMAHSIVLIHNHPHGSKKLSKEDRITLERLRFMGEVHNIQLEDFLIIGENGYYSFDSG